MRANGVRTLALIAFVCLVSSLGLAADLSGVPRIVDGDTLAIGSTKMRLEGIAEMHDILDDLKGWLAQLVKDAPHRTGELPEHEIDFVKRAIKEIERLSVSQIPAILLFS